ncbi:12688_t:CDS:2 [Funneliformis geosporum]|uniref:11416_t:CDS:1 n=1 Tax=Funneliformis geosporum TaxID=1117311 RepID=A0A9W4SYF8_9GLOM|nr:12688_t:CDS:2 [Funneliformis geosporum]CAI2185429.1 11416_t:CDS:2 [Funneliformis geosporum]
MPKSKKLQNQIENKLEKLNSDTLHNLVENLKATLKLLADKESPKEKNEFGEPIVLEAGLCSLVDEYEEDENEEI